MVYVLGAIAILGVIIGLEQIITNQAQIAFDEFDSKQKLEPIKPKPPLKTSMGNNTDATTGK